MQKLPMNKIIQGDCLEKLKELPENSVDSIVTDPPYELGFMGKDWDRTGIANNVELWKECLRVLKPGGHLLSFGGTRTYHRMAVAIENAGFEVRDMVEWIYGSGFPKSLNIGKAVDKLQGNKREVIGTVRGVRGADGTGHEHAMPGKATGIKQVGIDLPLTKGTSKWEGWGTALKPAHEPICLARKSLSEKSVAENVLKYGTGGINIDESRVGTGDDRTQGGTGGHKTQFVGGELEQKVERATGARFPANLIHDNSEEARECFPETKSGSGVRGNKKLTNIKQVPPSKDFITNYGGDSGSASRFFKSIIYIAKASKSERNMGCEGLEEKKSELNSGGIGRKISVEKRLEKDNINAPKMFNSHPTVKPIALMEYLIKMITPKGGIVLDPFMGSGSTCVAAKQNNFQYIGIEKEPEYIKIVEARLNAIPQNLEFNKIYAKT